MHPVKNVFKPGYDSAGKNGFTSLRKRERERGRARERERERDRERERERDLRRG